MGEFKRKNPQNQKEFELLFESSILIAISSNNNKKILQIQFYFLAPLKTHTHTNLLKS